MASILAMLAALWAHEANHALAYTVFFILLILIVIPFVLMVIVWRRHGVTIEGRMKRARGQSSLSIDGTNYDLTDISSVLKKVAARFDADPFHQRPSVRERLAIGALFGAPMALLVGMIGLNPEPNALRAWFAYALFGFDIGFCYLLVGANHSRGKHAWARTMLNEWRRAVGYGTQWELRHIIANGYLDKLLLFLPPPATGGTSVPPIVGTRL